MKNRNTAYQKKVDRAARTALRDGRPLIVSIEPNYDRGTSDDTDERVEQTTISFNGAASKIRRELEKLGMAEYPVMSKPFQIAASGDRKQIGQLVQSSLVKRVHLQEQAM